MGLQKKTVKIESAVKNVWIAYKKLDLRFVELAKEVSKADKKLIKEIGANRYMIVRNIKWVTIVGIIAFVIIVGLQIFIFIKLKN